MINTIQKYHMERKCALGLVAPTSIYVWAFRFEKMQFDHKQQKKWNSYLATPTIRNSKLLCTQFKRKWLNCILYDTERWTTINNKQHRRQSTKMQRNWKNKQWRKSMSHRVDFGCSIINYYYSIGDYNNWLLDGTLNDYWCRRTSLQFLLSLGLWFMIKCIRITEN